MKKLLLIIAAIIIAVVIYVLVSAPSSEINQTATMQSPPQKKANDTEQVETSLISSAPDNAAVFILEPGNNTTVTSPVTIKFGITNMKVSPAGMNEENSGHHHLLINLDQLPDMTKPLPATEQIIHFGKGQTETTIELEPGQHTLQLLLGNYLHIPHNKPVISKPITITVE